MYLIDPVHQCRAAITQWADQGVRPLLSILSTFPCQDTTAAVHALPPIHTGEAAKLVSDRAADAVGSNTICSPAGERRVGKWRVLRIEGASVYFLSIALAAMNEIRPLADTDSDLRLSATYICIGRSIRAVSNA